MNVSYAILVCNEIVEIKELINRLEEIKIDGDEIVIVNDRDNTSPEVRDFLDSLSGDYIHIYEHPLEKDFARQKNFLFSKCTKDYIVNIDADEIPHELFMENMRNIIALNPDVDVYLVPRINIVNGITEEYIAKMGWYRDHNGWINFPDRQMRVVKNLDSIKWEGKVHERLVGTKKVSRLPDVEPIGFYHIKDFERQVQQNEFYDGIVR